MAQEENIYAQVIAEYGSIGSASRRELAKRMMESGVPYRTMMHYIDMLMRAQDIYERAYAERIAISTKHHYVSE